MKIIQLAIPFAIAMALSGCASIFTPMGDDKWDCNRKQDPNSPHCRSFKSVELGTSGPLPASRFDREFSLSEADALNKIAPEGKPAAARETPVGSKVAALPHLLNTEPAIAGLPVREGPVIQRVKIKRWVDDNDALNEGSVVYREIRGNKWAGFPAVQRSMDGGINPAVYPHRDEESSSGDDVKVAIPGKQATPTKAQQNFSQPATASVVSDAGSEPTPSAIGDNAMPE